MKKLMIAAAVAAMGAGAFAECIETPDPTPCVFAYKVTLSGKTIGSKAVKGTAMNGNCVEKTSVCLAVPASLKLTGYVYGTTTDLSNPDECVEGCGCNDFSAVEAAWLDKKTKTITPAEVTFDQIDRIGKKLNQVQVLAKVADITLAGQGKVSKGTITSVKGNFTGMMEAPVCTTCEYNADDCTDVCDDTVAQVAKLCDDTLADATAAIVYGKWSMKASKAMAKKLTKNYALATLAKGYKVAE